MASYFWMHVESLDELKLYRLTDPLLGRAVALLNDGNPIEVGEMWYGGRMNYKIRYTPRVDYDWSGSSELYLNSNGPNRWWVMDKLGSIHSTPFLTEEQARTYMARRIAESTQLATQK